MRSRKIGLGHYLAYGSGDFLGAGTTALTAAWLLYFYTTFCGLTPIRVKIEQPGGGQRRGACSKKISGTVSQIVAKTNFT